MDGYYYFNYVENISIKIGNCIHLPYCDSEFLFGADAGSEVRLTNQVIFYAFKNVVERFYSHTVVVLKFIWVTS